MTVIDGKPSSRQAVTPEPKSIPPPRVPAVDRNGLWNPEWYKFFKPLFEQTRTNVTRIEEVNTDNQALITAEATARADADTALASDITTVSTTVDGNTTSITSNTTSINGLLGKYSLTVNVNNRITGFEINSGASLGSFGILADQLFLVHPNDDSEVQAFEAVLVEGTPTFRVNGNIVGQSLSVYEGAVGKLTAGTIQEDPDNPVAIFDFANVRWYRTDGTWDFDALNKTIDITF